jgi:ABC-type proline/glycine betaine transport system substrate-binding protein
MNVVKSLEIVSNAVAGPDAAKAAVAIRDARTSVRAALAESSCSSKELLKQLDGELSTWEEKLTVILKEPAARQGMSKHAHYWIEKLGKSNG